MKITEKSDPRAVQESIISNGPVQVSGFRCQNPSIEGFRNKGIEEFEY